MLFYCIIIYMYSFVSWWALRWFHFGTTENNATTHVHVHCFLGMEEYVLMVDSRASCMFFRVALSSHSHWACLRFQFPHILLSLISCLFANRAILLSRNDLNPSLNNCLFRASAFRTGFIFSLLTHKVIRCWFENILYIFWMQVPY